MLQNHTAALPQSLAVVFKVKQPSPMWPSIHTPRYLSKWNWKLIFTQKHTVYVWCQKLKITLKFLVLGLDKRTKACLPNGILLNNEKRYWYTQWLGWIAKALCWVKKKASFKRLYSLWFHFYDILEKAMVTAYKSVAARESEQFRGPR